MKRQYAALLEAGKAGRLEGETDAQFVERITGILEKVQTAAIPPKVYGSRLDKVSTDIGGDDVEISDSIDSAADIAADVHDALEDIRIRKEKAKANIKLAVTTLFAVGAAAAGPGGAAAAIPILTGALAKIQ